MITPNAPYVLYGAPASLYTGKARCYLRKQGIDFVEMSPSSERYLGHIVPKVGRWIIPVLETPDGTIIQDGADIIDHFEKGSGQPLRRFPAYPESPVLQSIGHVFELFGGEGLLRPAMHYRWNFDELNLDFIQAEFAMMRPGDGSLEAKEADVAKSMGRMRKAAVSFGVVPESTELIEASFGEWLDLFSAHLVDHPYLLGGAPTLGDYCLMAAMWAHLYRDPAPALLIKQRAPRVGRWVERMTTSEPYLHEYDEIALALIDPDEIPQTLRAMMSFVAVEYGGELSAHIDAANAWLDNHPEIEAGTNGLDDPSARGLSGTRGLGGDGGATFDWRGIELTTHVMPYRFWLLQRLQDVYDAAQPDGQSQIRDLLAGAGLDPWLDQRTMRRVERVENLEVWGPLL